MKPEYDTKQELLEKLEEMRNSIASAQTIELRSDWMSERIRTIYHSIEDALTQIKIIQELAE